MKKDIIEELYKKYIHLFELYEGEDTKWHKAGTPVRGIEVGSGWLKRVEELLEGLDWCLNNAPYVENPDKTDLKHKYILNPNGYFIKIFQIKEKFGRPTVYLTHNFPSHYTNVETIVGRFEGKCSLTCESCGKLYESGPRPSKSGWIVAVCEECLNKHNKEYEDENSQ